MGFAVKKPPFCYDTARPHRVQATVIGTLRGGRGRGVGDYTSLNKPYHVLIISAKAPYPPTPLPPKGPYDTDA